VAQSMAASVAAGANWQGHEVKAGPVLYVAGEGHSGFAARFQAWSKLADVDLADIPLCITKGAANLGSDAGAEALAIEAQRFSQECGASLSMVVIDTLSANLGGVDENSASAISQVIGRLRRHFMGRYGAAVILVHHEGAGNGVRARGSTAIKAALDHECQVKQNPPGVIRLSNTKARDHELFASIVFDLVTVDLGAVDGDPVTGPALVLRSESDKVDGPPAGLGKNQRKALRTLEQVARVDPDDIDARRATLVEWRDECGAVGIDRRRFPEARRSLESSGHIQIKDEFVFVCSGGFDTVEAE
jgi:hypothetical protein